MESSQIISSDKSAVVLQLNPQAAHNAVIIDDGQPTRRSYHNTTLAEFFKARPQALGTVQIMIGVVVFLFGIVFTFIGGDRYPGISVISGIAFWGSSIYIIAGSLSVTAQNKLHPCVVKASLGMNVFSAVTAGIAILLIALELGGGRGYCMNTDSFFQEYQYNDYHICMSHKTYLGTHGVLLVLSILQFIISICISGFGCYATCE